MELKIIKEEGFKMKTIPKAILKTKLLKKILLMRVEMQQKRILIQLRRVKLPMIRLIILELMTQRVKKTLAIQIKTILQQVPLIAQKLPTVEHLKKTKLILQIVKIKLKLKKTPRLIKLQILLTLLKILQSQ